MKQATEMGTGSPSLALQKILVTGGTGYLAANLINRLKNTDCHIVRLGRPETVFTPMSGVARIEDVRGDIRQRATWERSLDGVTTIFHFAAQTSAYVADENPQADLEVNVLPMLQLLEICRENDWHPSILFSGTVTETGIPESLPVDETHPDQPVTIYDLHKLMAENYLKYYSQQGIVCGAILRLANVYGPGPRSSSPDRGMLNQIVRRALGGEALTIYGRGEHVRDYIYVEDVVQAFLQAVQNIERLNGRHFVIGTGQGHTIAESVKLVAERVAKKTGRLVPVKHIDSPVSQSPIEARDFVADSSRFSQATGWRGGVSLIDGIDRTIDYRLTENGANR
ncbi:NAD-dependent epimerase/dehydratase family protein [Acidobacteria bacterium AH-259-O06]|nr:NAD-dependent epimerase/dehydratase family protein [Acidobacteria bacterium AH-259-O06]